MMWRLSASSARRWSSRGESSRSVQTQNVQGLVFPAAVFRWCLIRLVRPLMDSPLGSPLVSTFKKLPRTRGRAQHDSTESVRGFRRPATSGRAWKRENLRGLRRSHRPVAGTVQVQRHEVERQRRQQQAEKNIMPSRVTVACRTPGLSTRRGSDRSDPGSRLSLARGEKPEAVWAGRKRVRPE